MNKRSIIAFLLLWLPLLAWGDIITGNPNGKVTLVEYLDYNCPVCRAYTPTVLALAKNNPSLNIVERVVPLLSPTSKVVDAAILSTIAQQHFDDVQTAVFALHVRETLPFSTLITLLRQHHISMTALNRRMRSDAVQSELGRNLQYYARLKLHRIPVIQVYKTSSPYLAITLVGAQSQVRLQRAIDNFT